MNIRSINSLKGKKMRKAVFYGHAIPYLEDIEIKGRFIIIEGPDGSGRSTQIELLSSKLEADGHAVLNAGLRRSELIGQGILEAKRNFVLGRRTISLFYAADFADQLENKISGLQDASQAANRFLTFTPPFSQTHQAEPREAGYAGVSSNSDTVQLSDDVYVRTDIGCLHVDKL